MTNAGGLLELMPDMELMGHRLDLGRPELAALTQRYLSEPARTQTALLSPPTALIVRRVAGEETLLKEAFEHDGWFVKTCAGPGKSDCPILRGERCPLRESVDTAVVYVDPQQLAGGLGSIPRVRCAADSASPGVIALEGRLDPPRYGRGAATVGAFRGPEAILTAVSALMTSEED
ncbi:MAG: hypothetical protein ACR2LG_12130 [Actinomycetota bacterium]